jgi:serine/threonine protein kinase
MLRPMWGEELARRRIGEVLDGRYELRDLLGVGMTGAVYRSFHRYTHRDVAVKVMHQQLLSDNNAVQRFLREAKAVAKVGHPSIVEVIDAGETQDRMPYVVLELLEGCSLGAAIAAEPLSYDRVIQIGLELLSGLGAAHSAGIVHRDIKPDNVFLLSTPGQTSLKILDFGVAKNLESSGTSAVLTKPGATIGTPSYMSPEQAKAMDIDARTDLWSAGAVLFHAAAGRPPWVETSVPALLLKLVMQKPPSLAAIKPDAPANLVRAVDGALVPDLAARWPSAEMMAAALKGS